MTRRRKNTEFDEGLEFDNLFGTFHASSVEEDKEPIFKLVQITEEYAQPCRCCGAQPTIHVANFSDKEGHPNNIYISCSHCSECDGKWYPDRETALAEWNRLHMGSVPRKPDAKDMYDFVGKIMETVKFSV